MFLEEKEDLVSIIVPIYNVAEYLNRCVESLVNQTYSNIEILLLNDGSTDDSAICCLKWQQTDERIIFVSKKNTRQGPTRNLGVQMASGKYIMFVDADDYAEPTYVEKLYKAISENDADMAVCDYYKIFNNEKQVILANWDIEGVSNFWENRDLLCGISGAPWAKILRRSFLIEHEIVMSEHNGQDSEAFVEELILAKRVAQVKEPLYNYIIDRVGNATTVGINQAKGIAPISQNIVAFFKKKGLYEEVKEDLKKFLMRLYLYAFYHDCNKYELRACVDTQLHMQTRDTLKKLFGKWEDATLEKVLLIGNPTSRAYVSNLNPMSSFFSGLCLERYNFSSIISMMSPKSIFEESELKLENVYRQSMVLKDVNKEFMEDSDTWKNCRYIIIDFLEERYDLIVYCGSYYTKTKEFELLYESLYLNLNEEVKVLARNSVEVMDLWKEKCQAFISLLKKYFKPEQVCLLKKYISEEMREYDSSCSVDEMNGILREYYAFFLKHYEGINVIEK